MNKTDAAKKKATWLAYCLHIGWDKKDLDGLSETWDRYYDENGNRKPSEPLPASSTSGEGEESGLIKFLDDNIEKSRSDGQFKTERDRAIWLSALIHVKKNYAEIASTPLVNEGREALAFAEWIFKNGWTWAKDIPEAYGWYNDSHNSADPPKTLTAAELYSIFKQQPIIKEGSEDQKNK